MAPLDGVRLKVKFAVEHYEFIEAQARLWIDGKDHAVVGQHDKKTGWYVLRPMPMEAPPPEWSVILGELVHDLRSALDQLVWQLVLANGQTPGPSNQFPVFSDGSLRGRKKHRWSQRRANWRDMLQGVHSDDFARIKALQPYKRRHRLRWVPLEVLVQLSNLDKHQALLPVAAIAVPWTKLNLRIERVTEATRVVGFDVPTPGSILPIGEAHLVALQIDPPDADIEVKVQDPLSVTIGIGERGDYPLSNLLDLIEEVQRVIKLLKGRAEP